MIRLIYLIAALYDGILGLAFLFAPGKVFAGLGLEPPNHMGYVQFPGALLLVFAAMFAAVARNPVKNHNLIPFGFLLKISYCGVVLFYWLSVDVPFIWKPFFVADLVFIALFVWSWKSLSKLAVGDEGPSAG